MPKDASMELDEVYRRLLSHEFPQASSRQIELMVQEMMWSQDNSSTPDEPDTSIDWNKIDHQVAEMRTILNDPNLRD